MLSESRHPNVTCYSNVQFLILDESYYLQAMQLIPRTSWLCRQNCRSNHHQSYTDASPNGLYCSLFQMQNAKLRVLGFGSRTFVGAEKSYHGSKTEFLALKWTVCKHFQNYFYVPHFDVYADYNLLA